MYAALGRVARAIPAKTNFLNITVFIKKVGIEYLTSFTSLPFLVASKRICVAEERQRKIGKACCSFSVVLGSKLPSDLLILYQSALVFFFHWNQMNLCVSLLVQNNCLGLEICKKLKLKIRNSNGWELSKVSYEKCAHMQMSSDLPSGLSEFTMVQKWPLRCCSVSLHWSVSVTVSVFRVRLTMRSVILSPSQL